MFGRVARSLCLGLGFLAVFVVPVFGVEVRIKDLVDVEGARANQLVGMGLVVGLAGTGDKGDMAMRMLSNMALNFGVNVDPKAVKSKNVAVVSVTCELPPFVSPGQTLDVQVSALGDAKSLQGGMLLQTPLRAANGRVYAVAQGPLSIGGFSAGGQGAQTVRNFQTVARIPGGAIVEQGVDSTLGGGGALALLLRRPDFTTATRIAEAINRKYGGVARAVDAGRVEVSAPGGVGVTSFLASIEGLRVTPDALARVVVNERTGTVVMGGEVKLSTAAVSHGNLTVKVSERPEASQPNPLAGGRTQVLPRTDVSAQEGGGQVVLLPESSSVADLVKALNGVGASPRDLIPILQALDQAGALQGQLVIQ
ncbi:flagellar P-ring protein [Thermanaerovibrio acidaminovorans DSM 6589]|uniref:Flagellar P-ring protein n=1 Tax=Thermanaerovibrio acidaminovorans (strain ATCC 49978 / DSM 6589 / Su883) TaxID=525903 RepID=D1B5T5_THEAS|nr:flagellar basal body P-ring protein FlgI [Thermanaerovibrio acidaminovorans]ACZ19376.1 flagellar P-ring protein [Thermanaerovibrio acidaminovorans DSM 6589]